MGTSRVVENSSSVVENSSSVGLRRREQPSVVVEEVRAEVKRARVRSEQSKHEQLCSTGESGSWWEMSSEHRAIQA